MFLVAHGYGEEHQGEAGEDYRLDQADEEFQSEDELGGDERHQEGYHHYQDFAGGHIAEEAEGEGDDAYQFGDQFQEADEEADDAGGAAPDEVAEGEELFEVAEAVGAEAPVFHEDEGYQRQGEGHIEVGAGGAQEVGFDDEAVLAGDAVAEGQVEGYEEDGQPGVEEDEEEDGGYYGEGFAAHCAAQDAAGEVEHQFEEHFYQGLPASGDDFGVAGAADEEHQHYDAGQPGGEEGVGDGELHYAEVVVRCFGFGVSIGVGFAGGGFGFGVGGVVGGFGVAAVADDIIPRGGGEDGLYIEVDARLVEEGAARQSEHLGADGPDDEADDEQRGHADAEQQECPIARHWNPLPPWSGFSAGGGAGRGWRLARPEPSLLLSLAAASPRRCPGP